jgi:acetate kinase
MKILVINAGSSSLKYQLIDMQGETVLARVWPSASALKLEPPISTANRSTRRTADEEHTDAMQLVLDALIDPPHASSPPSTRSARWAIACCTAATGSPPPA